MLQADGSYFPKGGGGWPALFATSYDGASLGDTFALLSPDGQARGRGAGRHGSRGCQPSCAPRHAHPSRGVWPQDSTVAASSNGYDRAVRRHTTSPRRRAAVLPRRRPRHVGTKAWAKAPAANGGAAAAQPYHFDQAHG